MIDQRLEFYRNVAFFKRRRRRTIMYMPPERREETIKITPSTNNKSLEEYYISYSEERTNREIKTTSKIREETLNKIIRSIYQTQNESKNSSKEITYVNDEGETYKKVGGTLSWRTNNPGNLSFSSLESAKKSGAIGVYEDGKGHKFGIFKSEAEGEQALRNKLKERRFSYNSDGSKRTISNMIKTIYAPASDNNNVRGYVDFLHKKTGIDVYNRSVSDLSPIELKILIDGIKARELFIPGEIIKK